MIIPSVCPLASKLITPEKHLKEPWFYGGPIGVLIHDSAGPTLDGIVNSDDADGFCYHLAIDNDGTIIQLAYLSASVWHAGYAMWNSHSPNRHYASICLVSWGKLVVTANEGLNAASIRTWTGEPYLGKPRHALDNATGLPGVWAPASPAQLLSLQRLCWWFRSLGIAADNFAGHDEAALPRGRKSDPGGVLPWTMEKVRELLTGPADKLWDL